MRKKNYQQGKPITRIFKLKSVAEKPIQSLVSQLKCHSNFINNELGSPGVEMVKQKTVW